MHGRHCNDQLHRSYVLGDKESRTVTLSPGDSLQFQNEPLPDVVKLVGKDCVIDDIFIGKGGDVFLDLTHVDGGVIIPYRNVISLVEQGHATVLNN